VLPILALEVVSKKYNGEYDLKLAKYAKVGILYYVIYNSTTGRRLYKEHQSLEVYKLVDGKYQLLPLVTLLEGGRMVWLPEVGLGIGCEQGIHDSWQREWVYALVSDFHLFKNVQLWLRRSQSKKNRKMRN